MIIRRGNTPVKSINKFDLVVTLAVFVVAPALAIWWLYDVINRAIWWTLPPVYLFWLWHLFRFPEATSQAVNDSAPSARFSESSPDAIVVVKSPIKHIDDRPWQERVEEIERSRPSSGPHWARVLIHGHEGIQACIDMGDWDAARSALQRIAYTMTKAPAEDKAAFTAYMTDFAGIDPLVRSVMDRALPVIVESPGMRQTQFYTLFPEVPAETLRYVLYYAHELGLIKRQKKGNSYLIFPNSGLRDG